MIVNVLDAHKESCTFIDTYKASFTVIFAMYFGANISSAREYSMFDTAAIFAGDTKALCRLFIGFAFLNLLPFFYYVWILEVIGRFPPVRAPILAWAQIPWGLLTLLLGMVGAGFYRIMAAIAVFPCVGGNEYNGALWFYASPDDGQPNPCGEGGGARYNKDGFVTRPGEGAIRGQIDAGHHLCGSLLYILPPILWYLVIA